MLQLTCVEDHQPSENGLVLFWMMSEEGRSGFLQDSRMGFVRSRTKSIWFISVPTITILGPKPGFFGTILRLRLTGPYQSLSYQKRIWIVRDCRKSEKSFLSSGMDLRPRPVNGKVPMDRSLGSRGAKRESFDFNAVRTRYWDVHFAPMHFTRTFFVCLFWVIAILSSRGSAQTQAADSIDSTTATIASRRGQPDSPSKGSSRALILVTSESVDRLRTNQLVAGVADGESLLLRSASSLTPNAVLPGGGWRATVLSPQFLAVINSTIPFSQNYGSLWAGRGISTRTLAGLKLESLRVRIILAPEFILSSNSDWVLRHDFYVQQLPPDRSPYDFPFYVGAWTIDQPMRFGNKPIGRVDLGETTAMFSSSRFSFGFSGENEWWGPGIRNAIVLSNNAPGFPHLFLRTARPLKTRLGDVEMRWLVGGLTESPYFDTVSTNNTRSLASIAATIQTAWDPNLSFGFARSVYATATGWGQVPWRWFDVFAETSKTRFASSRKDQLFTLFSRWVFPSDGVELYGEWGRLELGHSLRDFLIAPNHSQGYTLGAQWRGPAWRDGNFRIQAEITQLEQSSTFRDEPVPSWYNSTRVIQGYTNRGEMLGASIGPGASTQFLAADYLRSDWRFGTFAGRIRWNEDVHDNYGFPPYASYCNYDVSLYGGVRGAKRARLGTITSDLTFQNRMNAFFQNAGGCPYDRRLDIHNVTLSFNVTPGQ